MAKNKLNGWIKKFFVGLALAGLLWKGAMAFSDLKYLKKEVAEIKIEVKEIRAILLNRDERSP